MESVLVRADDIGIIDGTARVQSAASSLKLEALQLLGRWQQSSISLIVYTLIIASVSIYDISLTIKYATSLSQLEVNPVGRWLMDIKPAEIHFLTAPTGMCFFLQLKALGTLLVIGIIHGLVRWRLDMGQAVAFGVSLFQVWLAGYLTFR